MHVLSGFCRTKIFEVVPHSGECLRDAFSLGNFKALQKTNENFRSWLQTKLFRIMITNYLKIEYIRSDIFSGDQPCQFGMPLDEINP
jgi:hypothetical protein